MQPALCNPLPGLKDLVNLSPKVRAKRTARTLGCGREPLPWFLRELSGLIIKHNPSFQRPSQRQIIRIFEVTSHRNTACDP